MQVYWSIIIQQINLVKIYTLARRNKKNNKPEDCINKQNHLQCRNINYQRYENKGNSQVPYCFDVNCIQDLEDEAQPSFFILNTFLNRLTQTRAIYLRLSFKFKPNV